MVFSRWRGIIVWFKKQTAKANEISRYLSCKKKKIMLSLSDSEASNKVHLIHILKKKSPTLTSSLLGTKFIATLRFWYCCSHSQYMKISFLHWKKNVSQHWELKLNSDCVILGWPCPIFTWSNKLHDQTFMVEWIQRKKLTYQ